MENAFIVKGGNPLKGTITLEGAKNVALKVVVAALLFDRPMTLRNIPNIKDIRELFELFNEIGVEVNFLDNVVTINPAGMHSHEVSLLFGSKIRASFLLFAPFLKKYGKARIPNPGGCRIGARPIDRMVHLMNSFGVKTDYDSDTGYYSAQVDGKLTPADFTFPKKTHTGTELALMIAASTDGHSVIRNCSLEPEIDELIELLNLSGATIRRNGEDIDIDGSSTLHGIDDFTIKSDRNNAVTFAMFALATEGDITVKGADKKNLTVFLEYLDKIGGGYELIDGGIRFYYKQKLVAVDVMTSTDPGFMTDWQAPWAVLMTQAQGDSRIHETVFENRFGYVNELNKLGAHIEYYKPHVENPEKVYQFDIEDVSEFNDDHQAILIHGPTALHGGVLQVTDMRAGATLLIGACAADGESVIIGASEIDRGYEKIEDRLTSLGAQIQRV